MGRPSAKARPGNGGTQELVSTPKNPPRFSPSPDPLPIAVQERQRAAFDAGINQLAQDDKERAKQLLATVHGLTLAGESSQAIAKTLGITQGQVLFAQRVLRAGGPGDEDYFYELGELDFWLRSDGNRRNPGTTADLIAAGLFPSTRALISTVSRASVRATYSA